MFTLAQRSPGGLQDGVITEYITRHLAVYVAPEAVMNHAAHSPRSSGSTEKDASVPTCRHRRHFRRADPRPAAVTGGRVTRGWDDEHRDAFRARDLRHHITTSSPRRAPRVIRHDGGTTTARFTTHYKLFLLPTSSVSLASSARNVRFRLRVIRHRAETRIVATVLNPMLMPRACRPYICFSPPRKSRAVFHGFTCMIRRMKREQK